MRKLSRTVAAVAVLALGSALVRGERKDFIGDAVLTQLLGQAGRPQGQRVAELGLIKDLAGQAWAWLCNALGSNPGPDDSGENAAIGTR